MKSIYSFVLYVALTAVGCQEVCDCDTPDGDNVVNHVLSLNGIDNSVALTPESVSNVRTIEFWFNSQISIDQSFDNFTALMSRETGIQNENEFNIAFQASHLENPGALRFNITNSVQEYYNVFSDSSSWEPDTWYHVAVTIDEAEGMSMFVNGVKQQSTNSYNSAIAASDVPGYLGSWGQVEGRFFNGSIDNVVISSSVKYEDDFSPTCTIGEIKSDNTCMYDFEKSDGDVLFDVSYSGNNTSLANAALEESEICEL